MFKISPRVIASNLKLPAIVGLALLILWIQAHEQILAARLWAEEASVYLQQATDSYNSWQVFLSPALGYYTLLSRLQAAVLQWVPLGSLGPVSMSISLSLLLLLWWTISVQGLQRGPVFFFALFSVLLANGELLANSLLLNYWYAAGMATMLFSTPLPTPIPTARWLLFSIVVVLGALSGPHALFLLPVAACFQLNQGEFRRWVDQWWVRLYAVLSVVQAGYIGWSLIGGGFQTGAAQGGHRFAGWTIVGVSQSVIKYNLVYPVYGYSLLDLPFMMQLTAICIVTLTWAWLLWKGSARLRALVVAGFVLQILYLAASIGGTGGPRYAFIVNVLLVLGIAGEAFCANSSTVVRRVAGVLLLSVVICPFTDQSTRVGKFAGPDWPDWSHAFSQACSAIVDTSTQPCIQAWPGDEIHWSYCPTRERIADACAQP